MVDLGYERAHKWGYGNVIGILEKCSLRRHRPGGPGGANIGESLLDTDRPIPSFHDKYEIEISIAHLADLPIFHPVAEKRANVVEVCEHRRQALRIEYPVCRESLFIRDHGLSPTTALGMSTPPKARPVSVASCLP